MERDIRIMLQKGHRHMRAEEYTQAVRIYYRAIRQAPRNPNVHYHFGNAVIGQDENAVHTAITAYDNAIDLRPQYPEPHFKKGLELLFSYGKCEESLKEAHIAADLSKYDPRPLILMGFGLSRLELNDGIELTLKSIGSFPDRNVPLFQKLRNEFFYSEDPNLNDM